MDMWLQLDRERAGPGQEVSVALVSGRRVGADYTAWSRSVKPDLWELCRAKSDCAWDGAELRQLKRGSDAALWPLD